MIFIFDSHKIWELVVILKTYFPVKIYYFLAYENRKNLRKTHELKEFSINSI